MLLLELRKTGQQGLVSGGWQSTRSEEVLAENRVLVHEGIIRHQRRWCLRYVKQGSDGEHGNDRTEGDNGHEDDVQSLCWSKVLTEYGKVASIQLAPLLPFRRIRTLCPSS